MDYKEKVAQAERLAELTEAAYIGLDLEDKIDGIGVEVLKGTPCAVIYFSHKYNEARRSTDNGRLYMPYDTGIKEVLEILHGIEAQPLE